MTRERLANLIRDRLIFVKIATALIWLTWLVSISLSGFTRDIEGKPIGTDHIAFYSAARLISEGRGEKIYDHEFLYDYQPMLTGLSGRFLDAYRNPPFYALFYVPSAQLPYLGSFWIWTAVSVAMLWFGLGWLSAENRRGAFVMALSFYPVFACFGFGQNSLLSFGFFCLTFRLLERDRPFLAGLAAGLLLYKPQLMLGLGIWWVLSIRTYWKSLVGLTVAGLFWIAISFLIVPVETRLFIEKLDEIAQYSAFMFWNLCNPRGFGTLIAYDDKQVGNWFGLVCSIVGIVCFVWFWTRHRQNRPLMFAAAVFLTLWASPHTMIYEWTLALIPAVLLWDRVKEKRATWLVLFAVSWIALFINTPLAKFLFEATTVEGPPGEHHGWAILVGVPAMAWVAWQAMNALRDSSQTVQVTQPPGRADPSTSASDSAKPLPPRRMGAPDT